MELQQQVTNLELSKRMKELGFKQESLFYWIKTYDRFEKPILNHNLMRDMSIRGDLILNETPQTDHTYPAYTVAELGEMLPSKVHDQYHEIEHKFECGCWKTAIANVVTGKWNLSETFIGETEADARAKMLIYLKENNLI